VATPALIGCEKLLLQNAVMSAPLIVPQAFVVQ